MTESLYLVKYMCHFYLNQFSKHFFEIVVYFTNILVGNLILLFMSQSRLLLVETYVDPSFICVYNEAFSESPIYNLLLFYPRILQRKKAAKEKNLSLYYLVSLGDNLILFTQSPFLVVMLEWFTLRIVIYSYLLNKRGSPFIYNGIIFLPTTSPSISLREMFHPLTYFFTL